MNKTLYTIIENAPVAAATFRMVLAPSAPQGSSDPGGLSDLGEMAGRSQTAPAAEMQPGQFVDIAIPGFYLRRPISVCNWEDGRITLYYKVVGGGTKLLATLPAGDSLELLSGLGRGFRPESCRQAALLVGGGLGAAPLYLLARRLKAQGKKVTVVLGFNKASEIVLEEEFRALCDGFALATMDGSAGVKGFVTDAIAACRPEFDFFYTCGPMPMMKALCACLDTSGEASLEERMGCGAGFCYGCSIRTRSGVRRVCKDGPVFEKEDILW